MAVAAYAVNLIVPHAGFMGNYRPTGHVWRTREKKGEDRISRLTRGLTLLAEISTRWNELTKNTGCNETKKLHRRSIQVRAVRR
jgi:hypothetical protein